MSRKTIALLSLLALPALTASAGDINVSVWPARFQPLEVVAVPVVMDIGFWIRIWDPGAIRLQQQTVRTFSGCVDLRVACNFNAELSCAVTPTGAVPGRYAVSMTPHDVYVPGAPPYPMPVLCVTLTDADLRRQPGGVRNVHVATVIVKVIPRM